MSKNATLQADGTWVVRDFTAEEEADYAAMTESGNDVKKAHEDAITQKATDKASATTKLKALGLTDAEIAALSG
tara:strand:+ start:816 stop:1037 length:222 start_codon:yes stop_codon:yes gene_type:complete